MPLLSDLLKAGGSVAKDRIMDLADPIRPTNIIKSGIGAIKSTIFSEIPQLSILSDVSDKIKRSPAANKNTKPLEVSKVTDEKPAVIQTEENTRKSLPILNFILDELREVVAWTNITAEYVEKQTQTIKLLGKDIFENLYYTESSYDELKQIRQFLQSDDKEDDFRRQLELAKLSKAGIGNPILPMFGKGEDDNGFLPSFLGNLLGDFLGNGLKGLGALLGAKTAWNIGKNVLRKSPSVAPKSKSFWQSGKETLKNAGKWINNTGSKVSTKAGSFIDDAVKYGTDLTKTGATKVGEAGKSIWNGTKVAGKAGLAELSTLGVAAYQIPQYTAYGIAESQRNGEGLGNTAISAISGAWLGFAKTFEIAVMPLVNLAREMVGMKSVPELNPDSSISYMNQKILPSYKTQNEVSQRLKSNTEKTNDIKNEYIYNPNFGKKQESNNTNVVNAPVTNTTIMNAPILTRNPEINLLSDKPYVMP